MLWVEKNIPKDELIVNFRWDYFPIFFYQSSNYKWISGLDPTFLFRYNPNYWKGLQEVKEKEADPINYLNLVNSKYYFIPRTMGIPSNISHNPNLEKIYHDEEAIIFRLKDK